MTTSWRDKNWRLDLQRKPDRQFRGIVESRAQVQVDSVRLAYSLSGNGPWMVLLHGWMCNRSFWRETVKPLVDHGFRCLRLDFRGHGDSEIPNSGYSIAQLAADVGLALDSLGVRSTVLVGHSMGGMVAQQLCLERPDLVKGLALVATIAADRGNQLISKRMEVESGDLGFRAAFEKHFHAWFSSDADPARVAWARREMLRTPPHVALDLVRSYRNFDLIHRLEEIEAPALVIGCWSDDSAVPEESRILARKIPGAHLKGLDGCGHFPMLERPEKLSRMLLSFADERAEG